MIQSVKKDAKNAVIELIEVAKLKKGSLVVIGCSTSEVCGEKIGTFSNEDIAKALFDGLYKTAKEKEIYLAVQCCEHLNRCLVIEEDYALKYNLEQVNAVPRPKAGGALATVAYNNFEKAVLVENVKADAGIDIGGTLIGMHLKKVAVPVRLNTKTIGKANIICARTRPKFVGGERAIYNNELM